MCILEVVHVQADDFDSHRQLSFGGQVAAVRVMMDTSRPFDEPQLGRLLCKICGTAIGICEVTGVLCLLLRGECFKFSRVQSPSIVRQQLNLLFFLLYVPPVHTPPSPILLASRLLYQTSRLEANLLPPGASEEQASASCC